MLEIGIALIGSLLLGLTFYRYWSGKKKKIEVLDRLEVAPPELHHGQSYSVNESKHRLRFAKPRMSGIVNKDLDQILETLLPPAGISAPDLPEFPSSLRPPPQGIASVIKPVDAAVFCQPWVAPTERFLVQLWLYEPSDEKLVAVYALQSDASTERRGTYSLPLDVPLDTRVDVRLEMPGLEIEEPDAVIIWRGKPSAAQFEAHVPADCSLSNVLGRVRIAVEGVPVGTLRFKVSLKAGALDKQPVTAREAEVDRYKRAFVSYSSQDRSEVLKRVQAFKIAGLSVFQDILDLDPGERWQRALYREIDSCDVFLLFWSRAAAASEWVAKEIDYAVARKKGAEDNPPAIQPVPIEGPPPPRPPVSLSHLHFNDALLAHIATSATAPTKPLNP